MRQVCVIMKRKKEKTPRKMPPAFQYWKKAPPAVRRRATPLNSLRICSSLCCTAASRDVGAPSLSAPPAWSLPLCCCAGASAQGAATTGAREGKVSTTPNAAVRSPRRRTQNTRGDPQRRRATPKDPLPGPGPGCPPHPKPLTRSMEAFLEPSPFLEPPSSLPASSASASNSSSSSCLASSASCPTTESTGRMPDTCERWNERRALCRSLPANCERRSLPPEAGAAPGAVGVLGPAGDVPPGGLASPAST